MVKVHSFYFICNVETYFSLKESQSDEETWHDQEEDKYIHKYKDKGNDKDNDKDNDVDYSQRVTLDTDSLCNPCNVYRKTYRTSLRCCSHLFTSRGNHRL